MRPARTRMRRKWDTEVKPDPATSEKPKPDFPPELEAGANLRGALMKGVRFEKVCFARAEVVGSELQDFQGADADFSDCEGTGIRLEPALLLGVLSAVGLLCFRLNSAWLVLGGAVAELLWQAYV